MTISKPFPGRRFADTREEFATFVTATGSGIDGRCIAGVTNRSPPYGLPRLMLTRRFPRVTLLSTPAMVAGSGLSHGVQLPGHPLQSRVHFLSHAASRDAALGRQITIVCVRRNTCEVDAAQHRSHLSVVVATPHPATTGLPGRGRPGQGSPLEAALLYPVRLLDTVTA